MAQGGNLQFPSCPVPGTVGDAAGAAGAAGGSVDECWEEERFSAGQPGLVVFDGGSYSLAPPTIGGWEGAGSGCCQSWQRLRSCIAGGRGTSWLFV